MGRPCGRGARTVRSTHSCPDLPRRPGQRPRHERDNDPSGPAALTRTCRLCPVSSWDSAWRPLPRTRLTTWLEPRPARTAVPHQPVRGAVPSRGARPPFQNVTPRGGASTTRTHCPTALQAGRPGSRCWQGGSRQGRCPHSEMATSPPCPHTASFLCRTESFPHYGDASPVRPHPVTSLNLNHLRKAPSPGAVRVGRGLQRTDWGETQFSP